MGVHLTDPKGEGNMPGKQLTLFKRQNTSLRRQVEELKYRAENNRLHVENSLSELISSAQSQSNLTSLNPIIQNNLYAPLTLNWPVLSYMYKTHGIIQAAIDMPVQDALRGGIDIRSGELGHDEIKDMKDFMEEFEVLEKLSEAFNWVRLYGGGGLIANTGEDPEKPLTIAGIRKGATLDFYPVDRWELQTPTMNPGMDWTILKFGIPMNEEFYTFYGNKIHRSRILTMSGKSAPHMIRWQLQGWGMTEVERMVEPFNTFLRMENVIYELLQEAKIDVMKMKGFNNQLLSAGGTAGMRRRIELAMEMKSYNHTLAMDAEDDFQQKQITFTGLAEVKKENRMAIACTTRSPEAKLFGQGASGFSSGEDSIENYNCMVESEVRTKLRRPIRKLLKIVSQVMFGTVHDFDFDFMPLRIMSSVEEEQVKTSKQARTTGLYSLGILTAQEAAEQMEHDKLIGADTAVARGALPEPPMLGGEPGEEEEGGEEGGKEKPGKEKPGKSKE